MLWSRGLGVQGLGLRDGVLPAVTRLNAKQSSADARVFVGWHIARRLWASSVEGIGKWCFYEDLGSKLPSVGRSRKPKKA